ncbi:MAG: hypothetical protein H7641_14335 [Candidatus Heimdallarchaeota archaeon]|nr:hypothetical protein [Candidatus Heimdallarchaeota archaeon]MCK4878740.1 hypothetical protein [Candidatus Heimdallarchaeota archaeon]
MRWWFIGRKVIKRPTNVVASLLLSILWCVVTASRFIIDYSEYDYQQAFIIPIAILGGLTLLFIFMLILEIRRIGAQKHIKTAEERYHEKYGFEEKVEDDPLTISISDTLKNLGAIRIEITKGTFPKFTFSFPVDHKFDSYQRISLLIERENIYQVSAELKYEFPAYLSIRKREVVELEERMFSTKKLFSQTYMVSSDDPKFAEKILEETLIDEVISEQEAYIDQISVHGSNFTAILTNYESIELLFILLSTILETYTL